MSKITEQEFLTIKNTVATKKEEIARATGRRDQTLETLKTKYGCNSVAEANAKIKEKITEQNKKNAVIDELEGSLQESVKNLSA